LTANDRKAGFFSTVPAIALVLWITRKNGPLIKLPPKTLLAGVLSILFFWQVAHGEEATRTDNHVDAESTAGLWRFRLLPRALSSDPLVNMTAVTEMTEEGRKRPLATSEHPVYFAAYSVGYRELGQDASATSPDKAPVEKAMEQALAQNGFLPATQRHPPTILLVYYWGVFGDSYSHLPSDQLQNLVRRASLVGGGKFAEEVRQAIVAQAREEADRATMASNLARVQGMVGRGGGLVMSPFVTNFFDPWSRFVHRDLRTGFLTGQSEEPIYFAMVSAFDYDLAMRKQKVLLWQTRMTAEWGVVSLAESLPPLIARGSRYLGRDMDVAATMVQNVNRHAGVKIGDTQFIQFEEPGSPAKSSQDQGKR
jgi:hypothetical protein